MQLNSWFKPWQFRDWRMKSSNIFLQDPQGPFVEGTIVWLPVWGVASTPFRTHPGAPRSKIRFFRSIQQQLVPRKCHILIRLHISGKHGQHWISICAVPLLCYSRNMPVDRAHKHIHHKYIKVYTVWMSLSINFVSPTSQSQGLWISFPLLPFWLRSLIHATLVDPCSQQAPWNTLHPQPQFSLEDASINEMWRDGDRVTAKFQSFSHSVSCITSLLWILILLSHR